MQLPRSCRLQWSFAPHPAQPLSNILSAGRNVWVTDAAIF
jgi:hypothetical protein